MSESILLLRDSFDPIGRGHIDLASAASLHLGCDVVFMPTYQGVASPENRLAMLNLALKKENGAGYFLDTYEIDGEGKKGLLESLQHILFTYKHKTIYLALSGDEVNALDEATIHTLKPICHVLSILDHQSGIVLDDRKLAALEARRFPYGKKGPAYGEAIRGLRNLDVPLYIRDYIESQGLYYLPRLAAYLSPKRLAHSLSVANLAYFIAVRNRVLSPNKAYVAGLLHDIAKNVPNNRAESLLKQYYPEVGDVPSWTYHQFIGPLFAQSEFKIDDEAILEAIRFHATGKAHMIPLGKILYCADKIEPTRGFDSKELIDACLKNYYVGFLTVLAANKEFLESKGYQVDNPYTKACFDIYLGDEED